MDKRTLKALEFGKVLEHLASLCASEAGKHACLTLTPLSELECVHAEQVLFDQTRTFLARAERNGQDDFDLMDFPDCGPLLDELDPDSGRRRGSDVVDADALWALRVVLSLTRKAVVAIRQGESRWPALHAVAHVAPLPEMVIAALTRCLGDDGLIKDESSPELSLVRGELRRLHQGCLRKVKDFAIQYNMTHYLQDDYMTLANDRYVLPLKANFKGRMQGIIHDYSNTGETCYFEPMFLVQHNNRLQELKKEEREEERKILLMLSEMLRADFPAVREAWNLLVKLDVLSAKSCLADRFDGHCPTVNDDGTPLELLTARHPLLALEHYGAERKRNLEGQQAQKVANPQGFNSGNPQGGRAGRPQGVRAGGPQAVDLHLRRDDHVLVISGGNAGGKTVCLKTLGLIAVMAYAGLPVPVGKGSSLPWWPNVHAFIGDEQSLDDHVSTFTAQICSLAAVWDSTDRRSLVLLDEFGAGTDPSQGAALAQAVLDELLARGAYAVAATHFPALKTYALTRDGVRAASVLFDPGTKRPLYRLAYDQVGASLALDVAREHGLAESVLRRAEHYLLLDGEDMSAVMDRLNALAAERETSLEQLHEEKLRTREKRDMYKERFDKDRERLNAEVRSMAQELMAAWKAGKATAKQTLKEMSRVRAELVTPRKGAIVLPEETETTLDITTLKDGQVLTHRPWGKDAVVREVDLRQKRVKLDMNGVTLWVEPHLLSLKGQGGKPVAPKQDKRGVTINTSVEKMLLRLDLRGKRADLALTELEHFLDRGLLSGMDGVEVLHGRGTGVLRKQVHEFLRSFPGVASYAVAPEDQGGDGVTIVTFK